MEKEKDKNKMALKYSVTNAYIGFVYLFMGTSTPDGSFNAKIQFIYEYFWFQFFVFNLIYIYMLFLCLMAYQPSGVI